MTRRGGTPSARERRHPPRLRASLLVVALVGGLSLVAVGPSERSGADEVALGPVAPARAPSRLPSPSTTVDAASTGSAPTPSPLKPPPVPEVGTHPASIDDLPTGRVSAPTRITIGAIGVDAAVLPVGVTADGSGALDVPSRADAVVWYRFGPTPGARGAAVIAGHVDYDGVRGSFFRLSDLGPGALVAIDYDDGTQRRFRVVDRRSIAKAALPIDEIFTRQGPARLTLITCGGSFDRSARTYRDNVVVQAVPVGS